MSSVPLKVWDGTQWVNIGVQGGTVLYQNEEPASPQTGMIWIDADSETSVLNDEDYLTLSTASATYAPSASPTFTGEVNLPATTNYDGNLLSDTLASKLDLAGGKILQVVRATNAATFTTTSTTYVDVTGMSVTITPQRSDSAIIVIATARCSTNSGTGGDQRGNLAIADSSNNNLSGANLASFGNYNYSFSSPGIVSISMTVIGYDTPATTAATTYKMRLSSNVSTTTSSVTSGSQPAQMYAIEVSA